MCKGVTEIQVSKKAEKVYQWLASKQKKGVREYSPLADRVFHPERLELTPEVKETENMWEDIRKLIVSRERELDRALLERVVVARLQYIRGEKVDVFTLEEKLRYLGLTEREFLVQNFKKDTLEKVMYEVNMSDLVDVKSIWGSSAVQYWVKNGDIPLDRVSRMVEKKDQYGRRVQEREEGFNFFVSKQYQQSMKKIIVGCLRLEYPYILKYNPLIYADGTYTEVYIKEDETQKNTRTMYIPYTSIFNCDSGVAVTRMTTYFNEYYGRLSKKPETAKYHIEVMQTAKFKRLAKEIDTYKKV